MIQIFENNINNKRKHKVYMMNAVSKFAMSMRNTKTSLCCCVTCGSVSNSTYEFMELYVMHVSLSQLCAAINDHRPKCLYYNYNMIIMFKYVVRISIISPETIAKD